MVIFHLRFTVFLGVCMNYEIFGALRYY